MSPEDITKLLGKIEANQSNMSSKLDEHINRVEPVLLEYHTSKLIKRKIMDGLKLIGVIFALTLSGMTIKEKLNEPQVKVSRPSP